MQHAGIAARLMFGHGGFFFQDHDLHVWKLLPNSIGRGEAHNSATNYHHIGSRHKV